MLFAQFQPACAEGFADLVDVFADVDSLHFLNGGQSSRRAHAFGPVGAGNERGFGGIHHGASADNCSHGMSIAQCFREDGDVWFNTIVQMRAAQG